MRLSNVSKSPMLSSKTLIYLFEGDDLGINNWRNGWVGKLKMKVKYGC